MPLFTAPTAELRQITMDAGRGVWLVSRYGLRGAFSDWSSTTALPLTRPTFSRLISR